MDVQPIRILIADDHTLFREGLRLLLTSESDIEVVAEVGTGIDAVTQALLLKPALVLMDIKMPGGNGIEAVRAILQRNPAINILMLTMFDDERSVFAAIRAGARGYVLKGADKAEILRAIRAVASGEALFGPDIADQLIAFFTSGGSPRAFPELTDREVDVLQLIAAGCNNQDIALRLSLSPGTVRNYISSIFDKLRVADRSQAIVKAREAGFG